MEKLSLKKHDGFRIKGPLVFIIMDGMGISECIHGDAFYEARTPTLDSLIKNSMYTTLKAHGKAVGLPSDDDMGNSEVGHNAIGAGRIFEQGAKLVTEAIASEKIFQTEIWKKLTEKPKAGTVLHIMGLLSDGNVHSHISHLFGLITRSATEGIKKIRLHMLLDGRDVPETSAQIYIQQLEDFIKQYNDKGFDYKIASGGGRMVVTMDRYEADWEIVKRGWEAHVLGTARPFKSAIEALETYRKEIPGVIDQYLPSFTVTDGKGPVGAIHDGDSVVFYNFRGDRAIEMTHAFEDDNFTHFDRTRRPDVFYAGMMQYDGDLLIPKNYLVFPPHIQRTISEYLANEGVTQYATSETQKFGHVTYFWNGNRSGKFDNKTETYFEVPSDKLEFNQRPWMKAAEITDEVIKAIESGKYRFLRLNYANGDMVGHTGDFNAAVMAAATVDLSLSRLLPYIKNSGGIALITADHGNCEEMFEIDRKSGIVQIDKETGKPKKKTSHTLNPVPFIIYHPDFNNEYSLVDFPENEKPGLANVAATILKLLGYEAPEDYLPSLIKMNQ